RAPLPRLRADRRLDAGPLRARGAPDADRGAPRLRRRAGAPQGTPEAHRRRVCERSSRRARRDCLRARPTDVHLLLCRIGLVPPRGARQADAAAMTSGFVLTLALGVAVVTAI